MSRRRQWGEDSTVRINLSARGSVTLAFKGNLFDLLPEERRLISDLSTTIQNYKELQDSGAVTSGNGVGTDERAKARL